ncbi:MAG: hypothetical protein CMQ21_03420 [Gammaproteobacteria bacterium]|nr:hypothetical protein [Gammaproteobacteria bacterium]
MALALGLGLGLELILTRLPGEGGLVCSVADAADLRKARPKSVGMSGAIGSNQTLQAALH